jgi:AmmeMemoRadiSam system protein B/AmmeMemoRadiSam system protein A
MNMAGACKAHDQGNKMNRMPAVAGTFYPADSLQLRKMLESFFKEANQTNKECPLAVVVPHAGYVFSGMVTAAVIKQIDPDKHFEHIILIGSSHTHYFNGASIYIEGDFVTPLGNVPIDPLAEKLLKESNIFNNRIDIHEKEHCLEVQLPFLQYWLKHPFSIVPVVVGGESIETSRALAKIFKPYLNDSNLFIISSDFSHYPDYNGALLSDSLMADAIISRSPEKFLSVKKDLENRPIPGLVTTACGWTSILTLLYMVDGENDFYFSKILYANSGNSPYGSKDRVVGYNGLALYKNKGEQSNFQLTTEDKKNLMTIARNTLEEYVKHQRIYDIPASLITKNLQVETGAFVTLNEDGNLRGCIGTFSPEQPLYKTVRDMTISSAAHDYRFAPVRPEELKNIEIEISVLTPLRKIKSIDEIVLGKHGIYIKKGNRGGTFLPQVATQTHWTKEEFLGHCAADKASIGWDGWKDADIYIYEAIVFEEKDF